MDRKDEEILKKLLPMFKIEAQDHLRVISSGLIELESSDTEKRAELIETVYRESHSLKGAARSVNRPDIVAICQSMESVFFALKRHEIDPSSHLIDLLSRAVDSTSNLIAGEETSAQEKARAKELVQRLESAAQGRALKYTEKEVEIPAGKKGATKEEKTGHEPPAKIEAPAEPEARPMPAALPALSGIIRISTSRLDSLLLQAEEMLAVKLATTERASELRELKKEFIQWKKQRGLRESDAPAPGSGEKVKAGAKGKAESFEASFDSRITRLIAQAEYDQRSFGTMVDSLLYDMKKTLMLPCASLLEIFPRYVRDLARDARKEVELSLEGGQIEIDRRVLEEMKDPLIHLVRNCIDHGIESPEERKMKGKPSRGNIKIGVASKDGRIELSVSDDGAGIEPSSVKAAAQRQGLISPEEAQGLGDGEALYLIFRSGLTTSPLITDLSGRGLGLAIVREKVEKLNGTVSIDTHPGLGTSIKMVVPVTLATFRGVLVRVLDRTFVLPSSSFERVLRFRAGEIRSMENRDVIYIDEKAVSLVRLADALELGKTGIQAGEDSLLQAAVLQSGGKRIAFIVDDILHEQEVLVKTLGNQLSRVRNLAAATLLGNGKVVPILNVSDLLISAMKIGARLAPSLAQPEERIAILVVEDSLTSRALLKNILESAGYEVVTAVDGIEALSILKTRTFDLVVSDVEMPRMNGFDLTAGIRADERLSELPVVLVTALESREDKERGIDVGANAYIVKSSFEQSNLLEVVQRLV